MNICFQEIFSKKFLSLDICVYIAESPGDGAEFSKVSRASEHGFVNKEKDLQTASPRPIASLRNKNSAQLSKNNTKVFCFTPLLRS